MLAYVKQTQYALVKEQYLIGENAKLRKEILSLQSQPKVQRALHHSVGLQPPNSNFNFFATEIKRPSVQGLAPQSIQAYPHKF